MPLTYKIAVLAGDGIGPEVMAEAISVLQRCAELDRFRVELSESLVGGAAIEVSGKVACPMTPYRIVRPATPSCLVRSAVQSGSDCHRTSNRNGRLFCPFGNISICLPISDRPFVCLRVVGRLHP